MKPQKAKNIAKYKNNERMYNIYIYENRIEKLINIKKYELLHFKR